MFTYIYEKLIDPLLRDVRKKVVKLSRLSSGEKVLDICCGTGAQVIEYGSSGIIAIGIDINPNMFKKASKRRKLLEMENVSFYVGDSRNLPFADNSFACIIVSFGLHDKSTRQRYRIVSEMKRVVQQDGTLIFVDFNVPLPNNIWGKIARIIEFIVGGSHYKGFKDYILRGGLSDIFRNCRLEPNYVSNTIGGLCAIAKTNMP